jgi:RNA polymerase sigma factor (TIGR02999 family)
LQCGRKRPLSLPANDCLPGDNSALSAVWFAVYCLVTGKGRDFSIHIGPAMNDVTRILSAIDQGDPRAAEQLLPLVYDELRQLAAQKMAQERPGQTLDATALVHEAYLRLVGTQNSQQWDSRGHFFAAAAEAMRRILVENARRKRTQKHGGDLVRCTLKDLPLFAPELTDDLLALDEALRKLEKEDPVKAKLVNLRHFAGLTVDQAAEVLNISPATADRYWAYARAWLHAEITRGEVSG